MRTSRWPITVSVSLAQDARVGSSSSSRVAGIPKPPLQLYWRPTPRRWSSIPQPIHSFSQRGSIRHSSSSSPIFASFTSFFKNAKPPTTISTTNSSSSNNSNSPGRAFVRATRKGDIAALRTAYAKLKSSGSASVAVTAKELEDGMRLLSISHASGPDYKFQLEIFNDLSAFFRFPVSAEAREIVLFSTCRTLSATEGLKLLRSWMELDRTYTPTLTEWNVVIRAFAEEGRHNKVPGVSVEQSHGDWQKIIKEMGISPDESAFIGLLSDIARDKSNGVEQVLKVMKEYDVNANEDIEVQLMKIYESQEENGGTEKSEEIARKWENLLAEGQLRGKETWDSLIHHIGHQKGYQPALELYQKMVEGGLKPDTYTNAILAKILLKETSDSEPRSSKSSGRLSPSKVVSLVDSLERSIGTFVDLRTWKVMIDSFLSVEIDGINQRDGINQAMRVYTQARHRGIRPDTILARHLICGLCDAKPPRFGEAMEIYSDWLMEESEEDLSAIGSTLTLDEFAAHESSRTTASQSIYRSLLKGVIKTDEPEGGVASAIRLLDEMRLRGVKISRDVVTDFIISFMRASVDHYEAFKAYSYTRALDVKALDLEDYERIISTFATLSLPKSVTVPPQLFFELVKDMRQVGLNPTAKVYTTLISQYTRFLRRRNVSNIDEREQAEVSEALNRVHAVLRLDSFVEVDAPLLNALMDAYNQVGAWSDCSQVWESLLERRPYEENPAAYQPSLNIILDACGHAGAIGLARNTWRWAKNGGVPLNRKNYEAWVECLCRLGHVSEATRLVCEDYKNGVDDAPEPNEAMLSILLRFCWKNKENYRSVPPTVREAFPEQWEQVRHLVETDKSETQKS